MDKYGHWAKKGFEHFFSLPGSGKDVHRGGSPISSHIARKVVRHFQLALQFGQTCPGHGWKLRCVRAPGIAENGEACPSPLSGIVSFRGVG